MFFFFKQKTAYEMRISDWSSDVCSSDLFLVGLCQLEFCVVHRDGRLRLTYRCFLLRHTCGKPRDAGLGGRSEERRVGKSVSVRVDLGGRRIIKKTTINELSDIISLHVPLTYSVTV